MIEYDYYWGKKWKVMEYLSDFFSTSFFIPKIKLFLIYVLFFLVPLAIIYADIMD